MGTAKTAIVRVAAENGISFAGASDTSRRSPRRSQERALQSSELALRRFVRRGTAARVSSRPTTGPRQVRSPMVHNS